MGFRRVLIVLDVTEAEAEHVVEALVPVSPRFKGLGIEEAFARSRSMAGPNGMLVQLRSGASAVLRGLETDEAYKELG